MQYENTKKLQKQRYLQVVQRMVHLSPKIMHQKRFLALMDFMFTWYVHIVLLHLRTIFLCLAEYYWSISL